VAPAERSVAERLAEALAHAASGIHGPKRLTVASLCRHAGISRNTLYRFYPDALQAIRRMQARTRMNAPQLATIRQLRAELAHAHALTHHLAGLVDHYVLAYRETQEQLLQRERELAELRRSRGSLPTGLRRTELT
jgi:AcrR family transcriptional regulator